MKLVNVAGTLTRKVTIMRKLLWTLSFIASGALILAASQRWVSFSMYEVLGFITGGYCVWLAVVQNIWNWPIGIINAVFFLILFLQSRLFADAGLQVIYVILGCLGWYWWLHGGDRKSKLKVGRISWQEGLILTAIGLVATLVVVRFLSSIGDVAPFWDGLTTVSSLIAQYMLTRKYLENWYVWIATDVAYIGLYAYKHLILTAILYAIFLSMCVVGARDWKRQSARSASEDAINIEGREALS